MLRYCCGTVSGGRSCQIQKGSNATQTIAWENWTQPPCANWKFEEGQKYLIYAEGRKGKLIVDGYCNRTRQIETKNAEALQEFAQLNDPVVLRKARRE